MRMGQRVFMFLLTVCAVGTASLAAEPASPPAEPAPRKTAERRIWLQAFIRPDVQRVLFERSLAASKPRAILGIDEIDARKVTQLRPMEERPADVTTLTN